MPSDGLRNCVISAAYGATPEYVTTFLRTFRRVNKEARILLLVSDAATLAPIAEEYGAELRLSPRLSRLVPTAKVTWDRQPQPVRLTEFISRRIPFAPMLLGRSPESIVQALVSLPVARLFHGRKVIASERIRHVLWADCRDVAFQSDPFTAPVDLELAQEPTAFGEGWTFNEKWVRAGFGRRVLRSISGRPVYCAGTIFGTRERVLAHVARMCYWVRRLRSWRYFGQDQGIHNFIVHCELSESGFNVSTNDRGRIATLAMERNTRICDGRIVDVEGRAFPVIHQYDRLPPDRQGALEVLSNGGEERNQVTAP